MASGLLYGKYEPHGYSIFFVTNRHVLQDVQGLVILRFNPSQGGEAKEFEFPVTDDKGPLWVAHPKAEIDVAVVPLQAKIFRDAGIVPITLFRDDKDILFLDDIEAQNLCEGDGIFLLGFPMQLVGEGRNYAIVRSGGIARIQDCLHERAYTFLVDASNFPGNSGGPVISKPEAASIGETKPVKSSKVIGIVSGYIPYQEVAVSKQTGRSRIIFEENSGLAIVAPMGLVRETVELAQKTIRPLTC